MKKNKIVATYMGGTCLDLHSHRIMVENTFHMMYVIIYTMPGLGYLL